MTRYLAVCLLVATAARVHAQQPVIQNGRVETRQATAIDRELTAVGSGPDTVWVLWREPMVDGDPRLCSTWSDGRIFARGETLEPRQTGAEPTQFPAPSNLPLEANTNVVVLLRIVGGAVERMRVIGDDCPIDAGGRAVYVLNGITASESVRYLESLTNIGALNVSANRRLAESAASAIGLHRDAAATAVLDRLIDRATDRTLRRIAASALARTRGAHGFERVTALLKDERDREMRASLVGALAESTQPQVSEALLGLARTDQDGSVRADAAYRYVMRTGQAGFAAARTILTSDADDNVKRRIVAGVASWPSSTGAPILIDLARTSPSLVVRKEAVSALSRSKDPGALKFLEELVTR